MREFHEPEWWETLLTGIIGWGISLGIVGLLIYMLVAHRA